jgi:hypothetical protein
MVEKYYETRGKDTEKYSLCYKLYAADIHEDDVSEHNEKDVDALNSMMAELLEESDNQLDDGSIGGDIYRTAIYTANMCIASRVYESIDPIFARDCMHTALEAGRYLMMIPDDENSAKSITDDQSENISTVASKKDFSITEKEAVLWAFAELLRTDIEIRNAYDHSMMAGMPQKMSRQKKYKMMVNNLTSVVFENDDMDDLKLLTSIAMQRADSESAPSESVGIIADKLCKYADRRLGNEIKSDENPETENADKAHEEIKADDSFKKAVVATALTQVTNELEKDDESNDNDSQLIKVIEYNVLKNNKKKLSEEERNDLLNKIEAYKNYLL